MHCGSTLLLLGLSAAHAWVLISPYPRGNNGLGYSSVGSAGDASHDWKPGQTGGATLNNLVWHWPAPTHPDDDRGLGKSITYALHPAFCDAILPHFPEDGSTSGHLDAYLSSLNCDSLKTTIHLAFATWAANSPHISFLDGGE